MSVFKQRWRKNYSIDFNQIYNKLGPERFKKMFKSIQFLANKIPKIGC